ncbi:MAG: OmpA family protein [Cocleimonas sp.]|nr:OmpA family protein [Cocleimonas sp.]
MIAKHIKIYQWAYLPVVLSSVAILATQAKASPQQGMSAQQVKNINYNYVGSGSNVGVSINDEGDTTFDVNAVLSEDNNSSTSAGLWAGVEFDGDDSGLKSGGVRLDHNWVVRNERGQAGHINKVYGAYDRNKAKHAKATVGFGQETESTFWEGHVSKGLSRKKKVTVSSSTVSEKAYDYGVGASVGTFIDESNLRVRGGLDYQWGDEEGVNEDEATLLSLSAGVEKFFQGTPHSVGVDIRSDEKKGGYKDGSDKRKVSGNLSYRYDFGGDNVFQPDRRYRRVRVEVPGKARATRYQKRAVYANKTTNVPVYGNKTLKVPYKQLVKSTMELEGQTFFKLNRANLIPSAQARLKRIAVQIRKNGYKGVIRITGNTCQMGDTLYDQRLSERRAASVRAFLIKEGFNPQHLIARGVGKSNPKYPTTPEQDFKNRRVDIEYVTVHSSYKTGYRNITKRVQTGTRSITNKVKTGYKRVMIDKGAPGTPRVVWRTEVIPTAPVWIKRALHNTIKHNRGIDTYLTTAGSDTSVTPLTPIANNDIATVITGQSITIDVIANDTDNEGKGIQIVADGFTQGANGIVVLVNGQFVYTSKADFTGTDYFDYSIIDASGDKATATVTVTVTKQGTGITVTAENFTDTIQQGTNSVLNVLNGSTGEAVTLQSHTQGTNGLVTAGTNAGELVYTPSADFFGTDQYTYTVVDKNGNTAVATVTITVTENGTTDDGDGDDGSDDDNCCTVGIPVSISAGGDSFAVLATNDDRTLVNVSSSEGSIKIYDGDSSKHTLFFDPEGYIGIATITYTLSDGSNRIITIECYVD